MKALWLAINKAYDIPLAAPKSGQESFKTATGVVSAVSRGTYRGFVSHYHITRKKKDCAGLDIVKLLEELK